MYPHTYRGGREGGRQSYLTSSPFIAYVVHVSEERERGERDEDDVPLCGLQSGHVVGKRCQLGNVGVFEIEISAGVQPLQKT